MKDNEEETKNGNYLKDRAESILNLVEVLDKIYKGKIICRTPTITHAIEELIAELCGNIYNVVTFVDSSEAK